jgi:hypothetical protein
MISAARIQKIASTAASRVVSPGDSTPSWAVLRALTL